MPRLQTGSSRAAASSSRPSFATALAGRLGTRGLLAVVLAVAILAYVPALRAPFVFDDIAIDANASIRSVATALSPPRNAPTAGRPVVNATFALDFAINRAVGIEQLGPAASSDRTIVYRITNLLLHLVTALVLFALARQTFRTQPYDNDWRRRADAAALILTALWVVHPLASESVDYITQRTEIIVSLAYLTTLYASARAWDATIPGRRNAWYAGAIVACALGMASKEVMVTAPIIVILYDRAFRVASWRELWSRGRNVLYAGLFATLIVLILLNVNGPRSDTVGFDRGVSPLQYLYAQGWAIAMYIRLAFWPDLLTIDYGMRPIAGLAPLPGTIVVGALFLLTCFAWTRVRTLGWAAFLGTWFFLLLAPSSSIVPIITEPAAERRVYLALVAVLAIVAVVLDGVARRITVGALPERIRLDVVLPFAVGIVYVLMSAQFGRDASADPAAQWVVRLLVGFAVALATGLFVAGRRQELIVFAIVLTLAGGTFARSQLYTRPLDLWRDAANKYPGNARAYANMAGVLLDADSTHEPDAETLLARAIAADSTYIPARDKLADLAIRQHRVSDAKRILTQTVKQDSVHAWALDRLGVLDVTSGESSAGLTFLQRGAARNDVQSLGDLGIVYATMNRLHDADSVLRLAIQRDATRDDFLSYLGAVLTTMDSAAAAVVVLERAAAENPSALTLARLSLGYANANRPSDAMTAARRAIASGAAGDRVLSLLGHALLRAGDPRNAALLLRAAVADTPADVDALIALVGADAADGDAAEEKKALDRVDQLDPSAAARLRVDHPPH